MRDTRISLDIRDPVVSLEKKRGEIQIDMDLHVQEEFIFAVDVYSFQPQIHPENHLAWWQFRLDNGSHQLQMKLDLEKIHRKTLQLLKDRCEIESINHWCNPEYEIVPLMECKLVFWNTKDEILYLKRILVKCPDPKVISRFYEKHHEMDAYSPDLPFLDLLHHYKLKILKKYFIKYFKGKVLDIGCGLSLFTSYKNIKWPFKIIAGDRVLELMKKRKAERPDIHWVVFDASHLPFKADSFDSLFAGEILEHVQDANSTLGEWGRIQKKGGHLIVTTPNKKRRINQLNREDWPISPDHLQEFSFKELNQVLLPNNRFRIVKKRGLYLELLTRRKWWREDYLQREGNTKKHTWLMKILFRLGFLFPKKAFGLLTVAENRKETIN